MLGEKEGQLYSYPAKKWKKKKRSLFLSDRRSGGQGDIETGEAGDNYSVMFQFSLSLVIFTDPKLLTRSIDLSSNILQVTLTGLAKNNLLSIVKSFHYYNMRKKKNN